jgi:enterobacteria phage integrase
MIKRKRRRLPPHVEANTVKGRTYLSFRIRSQNGPRIRLPDDPTSGEFRLAYAAAMGSTQPVAKQKDSPDSISAKITSYMRSAAYTGLSDSSKDGYSSRLEQIRTDHGHRAFSGLTKERIEGVHSQATRQQARRGARHAEEAPSPSTISS